MSLEPAVAVDPEPGPPPSAIRATLASPLYRGGALAVFLSALGMSAAAPQIALFLVDDLHVSLATAGLYYLTNLTAPVAGYLVGARSDRTGRRLGLFRLCALLGALGWAGIAFSVRPWMPFVVSAIVLAFAGAAGSQLFAAVHDELAARRSPVADGVISLVRMALTAGWIVGPVLGSLLAAAVGPRTLLGATALCTLAQVVPLGFRRGPTERAAPGGVPAEASAELGTAEPVAGRPGLRALLPLLAFTGLYVLVYAGEPIKYGYLPIHMRDTMHLPAGVSGAVIGIQPLVEFLLMPLAVLVARWLGRMRLMIVGAGFGVAANLCFALTGTTAGMFAGQVCMGAVWGIFASLGIVVAQRLLPTAVATASAIFMSSVAVASALGGLTGGIGVGVLGLPYVFLLPACYGLLATAGLALMSRSRYAVR